MQIKITNIDTLIFRDGKPFGSGDDTWTNSLIFPTPNVIYGAIRAIFFAQNPDKFNLANTKDDPTKKLKIKNILFYDENDKSLIYPLPQDIMKLKDKDKSILLKISENKNTSNILPYIFECQENCESIEGFVTDNQLFKYLKNKEKIEIVDIEKYIFKEPKIGNKRNDKTKTTDENSLFRLDFYRYDKLSLIIDFDGIDINDKGLLKLGGEGKSAYYEKFELKKLPQISELNGDVFKLYFLTPAIFKNGLFPNWIDFNTFEGEYKNIKLKLLAIANNKPQYIGGWDIKENRPKPMYKAVSAGSVYYFKIISGKEKIFDVFNYQKISDIDIEKGFGITIIGAVK
jgi:CRISPR-associated protein Cmr3